jgi:outer membrane protein W
MKKLVLSAALFCGLTWNAAAQTKETKNPDAIKPVAGEVTLEANVNLLNGSVNLSNALQQIRGRYFLSDNMALRLGGNLRYASDTPSPGIETSTTEISLAPGIEKHFAGTKRLSPYIGADLLFGLKSARFIDENPKNDNIIKTEIKGSSDGTANSPSRGNLLVGLAGVAGFDFYVAQHLYLGYELGLEVSSRKYSDIETHYTFLNGQEVLFTKVDGKSNFNFGPNVRNGIRLGFVF